MGKKDVPSSTEVGSNNNFGNGTVIGNNNDVVINQDNSATYDGDKENTFILELISPFLIKKYGKTKIGIGSIISFISGLITIGLWLNSSSNNELYEFLPSSDVFISQWFFYFGIVLIIVGGLFFAVLNYHSNTKCENCKKEFAYRETKDPKVEEVNTSQGTRVNTTRYYKCKFCDHESTPVNRVLLENQYL